MDLLDPRRVNPLEKLLALRPTNAASRLGPSSLLPLLNVRELLRANEGQPGALACVQIAAAPVLPAVLRAARDEDAAIGLSCAFRPSQRDAAERFFQQLRSAAAELDYRRPVFLQAGPMRLTSLEGRAVEAAAGDVFRFIDAGFTLISLDVSALDAEEAVRVAEIARPAIERELAVEIAPPRVGGQDAASDLERFLERLAGDGLRPDLIRVSSRTVVPEALPGAPEPEPDFEFLQELSQVASAHGAALALEDHGTPHRRLSAWAAAGVRKVDVGEPLARRVLQVLPSEVQETLAGRAQAARIGLGELLAQLGDPLGAVSDAERERAEALCYGDAADLLAAIGAQGSATHATTFLAGQTGQ